MKTLDISTHNIDKTSFILSVTTDICFADDYDPDIDPPAMVKVLDDSFYAGSTESWLKSVRARALEALKINDPLID